MTRLRREQMVAFWRYDRFPFVLGGHVVNLREDGSVETDEYGRGCYFKPLKILPKASGEAALAQLRAIRAEHDAATRIFNVRWRNELRERFPWIGEVQ